MTREEAQLIMDDACKVWDAVSLFNEKHPEHRIFIGESIQLTGDTIEQVAEALGLPYTLHPTRKDGGLTYLKYNGYGFFGGWGYE